jgi:hypothetical protein
MDVTHLRRSHTISDFIRRHWYGSDLMLGSRLAVAVECLVAFQRTDGGPRAWWLDIGLTAFHHETNMLRNVTQGLDFEGFFGTFYATENGHEI